MSKLTAPRSKSKAGLFKVHKIHDGAGLMKNEKELEIFGRAVQLIHAVTGMLSHKIGEKKYLQSVCDLMIKEGGGYHFCWIGFKDTGTEKRVRPIVQSGVGREYLAQLDITWDDSVLGRGPTGTAIRTQKTAVCQDILKDPSFKPWCAAALQYGYTSSSAIPFRFAADQWGVLNVYSKVPFAFCTYELKLLEEVAHAIGFGIDILHKRDELRLRGLELGVRLKELNQTQKIAKIGNWTWDIRTGAIIWSDEMFRIFGFKPRAFQPTYGQYIAYIHPDDKKRLEDAIRAATQEHKPYNIVHRLVTSKGVVRIVNGRGKVIYDSNKKPVRMMGSMQDLTVFFQAQTRMQLQQLKISEAHAHSDTLLASIGDGVIAVNTKGAVTYVNDSALNMLRFKVTDLKGKLFETKWKMFDASGVLVKRKERPLQIALDSLRKVITNRYIYATSDGYKFPVLITTSPVLDGKELIGAISVFHDITAEKRIDRAKSEFISLASHQLRTPLSTIKWYAEALATEHLGPMNQRQHQYTKVIFENNERLIDLVSSLLSVSRIEQGTFNIVPEQTDVAKIIHDVLLGLEQLEIEKNIQMHVECAEDTKNLLVDPHVLVILFQNLLANAMIYSHTGGNVGVRVQRIKDNISIEIWDDGIGIPQEEQKKLFTKFYRAENARLVAPDGTGLGLYIVKSVVDASGGSIRLSSTVGVGTDVVVLLPIRSQSLVVPSV